MPKFLAYELFEVTAGSQEEAIDKVKADSSHKKSVVYAAPSLRELAHPGHLEDSIRTFGTVGAVENE